VHKKRYIITGGAGFIGSALSERLLQLGNEVVVIDNLSTGAKENIPEGATLIQLDLSNPDFVESLPSGKFDAVCHLAAQSSGPRSVHMPYADLQANAASTLLLTRWCIDNKIFRFLYASSMAVYGNPGIFQVTEDVSCLPVSYYGVSKLTSENLLRLAEAEGLKTTSFRMFSVYGPGQDLSNRDQGMLSIYLSYLLEGSILPVTGSLERFRDFVYIDDVINAWINAITTEETPHRTYNLGSGRKTTVRELIGLLLDKLNLPEDHPVEEMQTKESDQVGVFADITRSVSELGFHPGTKLEDGINNMVRHYKSRME
jgi:UDP-glucose 4-epimerase